MHLFFLVVSCLHLGCVNSHQQTEASGLKTDTIKRPAYVSKRATLINFGGDELPVFVWAEYIGPLIKNGRRYSHIHGVKFYYIKARKVDTVYYENLELRKAKREFDFANCKVLDYPGGTIVGLASDNDSITLFHVLETDEFKREHKGVEFKNIPTISINKYNEYSTDIDMEFSIKKIKEGGYLLILNDGSKIPYKLCQTCNEQPEIFSFLNREDGKIYFINRDCYLELVNSDDAKRFQELR